MLAAAAAIENRGIEPAKREREKERNVSHECFLVFVSADRPQQLTQSIYPIRSSPKFAHHSSLQHFYMTNNKSALRIWFLFNKRRWQQWEKYVTTTNIICLLACVCIHRRHHINTRSRRHMLRITSSHHPHTKLGTNNIGFCCVRLLYVCYMLWRRHMCRHTHTHTIPIDMHITQCDRIYAFHTLVFCLLSGWLWLWHESNIEKGRSIIQCSTHSDQTTMFYAVVEFLSSCHERMSR